VAIRRAHVKAVSLGMPLLDPAQARIEGSSAKLKLGGPIFQALRNFLGDKLDHMNLEDALDGNIQATIELKWAHSTTPDAQGVLDDIAVAMRNFDPDEVEIQLNDDTKVPGRELKLVVPIKVNIRDNIVEQTSLFKIMRETMKSLIEAETIPG
jgi:hypothetical protein